MFAQWGQKQPKIQQRRSVQLQPLYGGPSGWSQTCNSRKVIAPAEMTTPYIFSGIVKRRLLTGYRINCNGMGIFVAVTGQTCVSKVVRVVGSSFYLRSNVFQRKIVRGVSLLSYAIFTAKVCSLSDEFSDSFSYARHAIDPIQASAYQCLFLEVLPKQIKLSCDPD